MALLQSAFGPDTDIDPILRAFNVFLRTFNSRKLLQYVMKTGFGSQRYE